MDTAATFLAIRATGAEFARRTWNSVTFLAALITIAAIALVWWLVTISAWWWLLAIPFGIAISIAAVILLVFWLLIRHVRPIQTKEQTTLIRTFVDKLQFVSEFTGTPKFIILFRAIRSLAAPRSDSYLRDIFETKDLKKNFQIIADTFTGK